MKPQAQTSTTTRAPHHVWRPAIDHDVCTRCGMLKRRVRYQETWDAARQSWVVTRHLPECKR